MAEKKQYYCKKCNRTMAEDQFYGSNNLDKYPEGKLDICKKCITMHVDNWNPETYVWILQECDVPYVPDEWMKLLESYGRDKSKVTGMTILGRYLSKMKLKQYKDFRFKDTEFLQEMADAKLEQTMKRQGYEAAEIAMAVEKNKIAVPEGGFVEPVYAEPVVEDYFAQISGGEEDFTDELTDEDRTYLRLKWGKTYKPEEWVRLEQLYEEMMASYDVQGAGHIDTLKLICKTSLKAHQLIDLGDVESYQKMSKVYDSLMKSGKFTAAQNKAEQGEYVDCICELVQLCEEQGFIPRYYTDGPQDKVDKIILDMQKYTHDLVTEEMGLGNLIENAIKQLQDEREAIAEAANKEDGDEDDALFNFDPVAITDKDMADFRQFEENLEEEDDENGIS